MSFQTKIRGHICIVTAQGKIDLKNVGELKKAVTDACQPGIKKLVLNFREVTFIDSTGIGGITTLINQVFPTAGKINIVDSPGNICNVFILTGLAGFLNIHPTLEDALRDG